jgi:NADPH:quinone reductase-like Zn-dependent oxidoreductase
MLPTGAVAERHKHDTVGARWRQLRTAANDINGWMAAGALKAEIDRVLPRARSADAHRLKDESAIRKSGARAGRIVLKP